MVAWQALANAMLTAPVIGIRLTIRGKSCRVDTVLTLNARTATVRSAWHYATDDSPCLVTAFPTT